MWFHHRTLLVCCIIISCTFASHLRPRRQAGGCISGCTIQSCVELFSNHHITVAKPYFAGRDYLQAESGYIAAAYLWRPHYETGDWPWMVALGYRSASAPGPEFKCGATLISRYWVITAAHCIRGTGRLSLSVVRLGDLNLDPKINDGADPIDIPVDNVTVHPQYSTDPMINDIALIRLRNPVQFKKNIRPICLLSGADYRRNEYYNGKRPFIIGWGAVQWGGATTTMLQETGINMVDIPTCARQYANRRSALINDKVLCAAERGKDACQGDSGGPLIFPGVSADGTENVFYLGGIISYGIRCDNPDYPGVYTRVAEFIDWINQVTGERF